MSPEDGGAAAAPGLCSRLASHTANPEVA